MAGKTLLRFWQVAQQVDAQEQIHTFKTEVEFIASALSQIGQRIPLASKHGDLIMFVVELTDAYRGILFTAFQYREQDVRCELVLREIFLVPTDSLLNSSVLMLNVASLHCH